MSPKVLVLNSNNSLGDVQAWARKAKPLLDGGQGKHDHSEPPHSGSFPRISLAAVQPPLLPSNTSNLEYYYTIGEWGDGGPNVMESRDQYGQPANRRVDDEPTTPQQQPHGLRPPRLQSDHLVTGATTPRLRLENKRRRKHLQRKQAQPEWWTTHMGTFHLPPDKPPPATYLNQMCPRRLALYHPAADTLLQYATAGCPANTGRAWTIAQMQAAIDRGPHTSALVPDAMEQLDAEIRDKVLNGQARLVKWKDIRHDPPPQLKVSPIAMVPHKSRPYRAILDLSFSVKLHPSGEVPSVNGTTVKMAPQGAIDQIGHVLPRIIHAFAAAGDTDTIFMAKWDIKDGFWRGWIESPPYFCTASEMGHDMAVTYIETPVGSRPDHKFLPLHNTARNFRHYQCTAVPVRTHSAI